MAVLVLLLRKNIIIKKLRECWAISEESTKTLKETGVFNPNAFPMVTEYLVNQNILIKNQFRKVLS